MAVSFRKPTAVKQGLKILGYGEDGCGKSLFGLSFPKIAIIDSESKLGVYENNAKFNKNIVAIADTTNYYDVISLTEQVIKSPSQFGTMIYDSETNLYESMQVAMMELEEKRARKKGGDVDDQTVSQRGWGKVKLNNARLKNLKAQLSAKGITIISIAHKEDIMQPNTQIKIGEKPALRKNSKHDYDVVFRFFKETDMATGKLKMMCEVEKDTTQSFAVGEIIDTTWADPAQPNSVLYDRLKPYLTGMDNNDVVTTSYDKAISDVIETDLKADATVEEVVNEFTALYKELLKKNPDNKMTVRKLLDDNGIDKYSDPSTIEQLKVVIEEMKKM